MNCNFCRLRLEIGIILMLTVVFMPTETKAQIVTIESIVCFELIHAMALVNLEAEGMKEKKSTLEERLKKEGLCLELSIDFESSDLDVKNMEYSLTKDTTVIAIIRLPQNNDEPTYAIVRGTIKSIRWASVFNHLNSTPLSYARWVLRLTHFTLPYI